MERLTKRFTDGTYYCEDIEDVGIKGINAPTYVGKVVDKLAGYEDLEEQGLLLRLYCNVGDTVYCIEDKKIWDCIMEFARRIFSFPYCRESRQWEFAALCYSQSGGKRRDFYCCLSDYVRRRFFGRFFSTSL